MPILRQGLTGERPPPLPPGAATRSWRSRTRRARRCAHGAARREEGTCGLVQGRGRARRRAAEAPPSPGAVPIFVGVPPPPPGAYADDGPSPPCGRRATRGGHLRLRVDGVAVDAPHQSYQRRRALAAKVRRAARPRRLGAADATRRRRRHPRAAAAAPSPRGRGAAAPAAARRVVPARPLLQAAAAPRAR